MFWDKFASLQVDLAALKSFSVVKKQLEAYFRLQATFSNKTLALKINELLRNNFGKLRTWVEFVSFTDIALF